ncbi:uncharacterized protein [Amphiura filiformis]|uniref:uncharacterized protein n=1 Tax=Amphiura filiformis TaxID=82378 RepID=UPI003B212296
MMTIAAVAGTRAIENLDDVDALPVNLGPIWEKLNRPMQPVTIGQQGKTIRPKPRRIQDINEQEISEADGEDVAERAGERSDSEEENDDDIQEKSSIADQDTDVTGDMQQYSAIQKGDLVAVYVAHHWRSSPLIGLVHDVILEEESFVIHWYSASWSGKCSPLYDGGGGHRRPKTEKLDIRCCLLWQFKLTSKKEALSSATVQKLKSAYRGIVTGFDKTPVL